MIADHLPALQVVVPLLAAPLCVMLHNGRATWILATAVSWVALAIAVALLLEVEAGGAISYHLGGWAPPWGIEYRIDRLGTIVLVIVSAIAAVTAPYAWTSVAKEIPADRIYLFFTMYCLCLAGLLGITVTGDAFNLFVFLEVSSLSSYVLISMGRDRRALIAAYRYLIIGTVGATFYIIGVGLMYQMTGTLNMADLAARLPAVQGNRTVLAALAFLTVGICLKLALFPLHLWLPNAYAYAPSAVTVFLAATATKVAVYVLIRVYFTIFGATRLLTDLPVHNMLLALALVGMFAASAVAIFQRDVKRMLAYSSIAQVGYMVLGIGLNSVTGLTGGVLHMFNHALMKGTLFMAMGCVVYRLGSAGLDGMAGLGRRMPVTMAAFVVGGLGLIGVPLTSGFISKWVLIQAALEKGWWAVAVAILLSSLLAVAYVWRVVEVAYFRSAPDGGDTLAEAPAGMLVPLWVLAGATLWFGIDGSRTVGIARAAAASLLGTPP